MEPPPWKIISATKITILSRIVILLIHSCIGQNSLQTSLADGIPGCISTDPLQISDQQLFECQRVLRGLLHSVNEAILQKSKRLSPVSASLPRRDSPFILNRLTFANTLRENSSVNRENDTIVRKKDPIADQRDTTQEEQINNSITIRRPFYPTRNSTTEECRRLSQQELVKELKQKGTYNPDLMAWDVTGIIRFLERSIVDQYERQTKIKYNDDESREHNMSALEHILNELDLNCDVRTPTVLNRLKNLTIMATRRSIISPSLRKVEKERRSKRNAAEEVYESLEKSNKKTLQEPEDHFNPKRQKIIGDVNVIPFGCDKRGGDEDGYLRLCSACQAIRRLPDSFFPPFINEVMCDDDKACLYFYDFPHGKCKQKHMNFVVLKNVGTSECQIWQKFNLNVRVSCECFVDEMSFFAKYV